MREPAVRGLNLQSKDNGHRETEGSGWEGKLGQGEDILSVWSSAHQSDIHGSGDDQGICR